MWQQLIEVLNKICNAYKNLAELGEKKRTALVAVDMKALSKILEQEKILTSEIQNFEKQRGATVAELSKDKTFTDAENFYKTAPNSFVTKKLLEIHRQLSQNVERTLQLRENNQILAKTSLDNVTFKLNRISGASVEPTYGTKGSIVTHQKNFDYKA